MNRCYICQEIIKRQNCPCDVHCRPCYKTIIEKVKPLSATCIVCKKNTTELYCCSFYNKHRPCVCSIACNEIYHGKLTFYYGYF